MILCKTLQEHIIGLGQLGVVQEVSLREDCIFTTKLTMKLFKTWGMERRSVTKVLRALSKASSPYNLGFQSVRSAISSIHRREPNNLAHILVYIQGDFFNWASPENVFRLAPPKKRPDWPPLHFEKVLSMAAERGEIPNTFNIFDT